MNIRYFVRQIWITVLAKFSTTGTGMSRLDEFLTKPEEVDDDFWVALSSFLEKTGQCGWSNVLYRKYDREFYIESTKSYFWIRYVECGPDPYRNLAENPFTNWRQFPIGTVYTGEPTGAGFLILGNILTGKYDLIK